MTAITIGEVLAGLKSDVDGFIDQGHNDEANESMILQSQ